MPLHTPAPVSAVSLRGTSQPMRHLLLTGLLALGAVVASTPSQAADKVADKAPAAVAPSASSAPARMAPGMPGGMHRGMGQGEHGEHGGMGMMPFGRHLDRVLTDVKATDAQRQQIKQITDKARADVQALHEQGKGLHERVMTLWTAPKLDAAEAEKLRQQMLAQHDQVSKRMTQAMLDVGNVLTPEQRAKAAELIKSHRARMMDRMQGMADRKGDAPAGQRRPGGPHDHAGQPGMDR